ERPASRPRSMDHRRRLLLRLRWYSRPGRHGEHASAGPHGDNPASGRVSGRAGPPLVLPGARMDDGGGGWLLGSPLLPGTLVRRSTSQAAGQKVRPVRVRERGRLGQGEQALRAARPEGHPDRSPHSGRGHPDLHTGRPLPDADPRMVPVLYRPRQRHMERGAHRPRLVSGLPMDAGERVRLDHRVRDPDRIDLGDRLVRVASAEEVQL
ncbi:MAG: hypothetical protein AVDCRST_MAG37-1880, partial [uncultured Rubrobacteraceae bacterium]